MKKFNRINIGDLLKFKHTNNTGYNTCLIIGKNNGVCKCLFQFSELILTFDKETLLTDYYPIFRIKE